MLEVEGCEPTAFAVGDDGRGRPVAPPATPTLALGMDRDTFVRLVGGRCAAEPGAVRVEGDHELGARVLDQMATTP